MGDARVFDLVQCFDDLAPHRLDLLPRELSRRCFRLCFHDALHCREDRIRDSKQSFWAYIVRTRVEDLWGIPNRFDLQVREGFRGSRPGDGIGRCKQVLAFHFFGQPPIPFRTLRKQTGHMLWVTRGQLHRDRKLPAVWFTDGFEPNTTTIGLESNQGKGRTGLELAEVAIPTEATR